MASDTSFRKQPMIRIYPDFESLSEAAADLFVAGASVAVEARGQFAVGLSGGSTPQLAYRLLARSPRREQAPWASVHVFWGDERCVPAGDPRHNATTAAEVFLNQLPIPPMQIHPIACDCVPEAAATAYEDLLRDFFREVSTGLDLVFLGLGEDGHTASLFPHSPVLHEQDRWVQSVFKDDQSMYRVTMTPRLINMADHVAFLVAGEHKAEVLRKVLEGPYDPESLPAQLIRPVSGSMSWMVDRAAASGLTNKPSPMVSDGKLPS
jgi:6-phosphogluconolactonase